MARERDDAYGLGMIVLHWTIAALFVGQLAFGFAMSRFGSLALQFTLIQWHKSFGFLVLGLSVLRLGWAVASRRPGPVATLGPAERIAARGVQGLLYALTIIVPLTGWALVSTSTLAIPTFAFNLVVIPHLPLVASAQAEGFWSEAHAILAYATGILAAGHAAAALTHHFLRRDDVLVRMMRPRRALRHEAPQRRKVPHES